MRISRQQVADNREHLLATAMTEFRKHGFDGVGVADLMKAANMSLGSFYGYFDSKEQLIAESSARAITGTKEWMKRLLENDAPSSLAHVVDEYLSQKHRDNLSSGCALAALGSEMTHQSNVVRRAVTEELEGFFTETEGLLDEGTAVAKQNATIAVAASLIGGLILSRIVDDPALSDRILNAVSGSIKQSNQPANAAK